MPTNPVSRVPSMVGFDSKAQAMNPVKQFEVECHRFIREKEVK